MTQWNDVQELKTFYDQNAAYINQNPYFPSNCVQTFLEFIIEKSNEFDKKILNAAKSGDLSDHFEILSKGIDLYEFYPKTKAKHQVLRLYGIKLGETYIVTGSAIKLTQEMKGKNGHPTTENQLRKINQVQDFLKQNYITDEESFFDYLSEQ